MAIFAIGTKQLLASMGSVNSEYLELTWNEEGLCGSSEREGGLSGAFSWVNGPSSQRKDVRMRWLLCLCSARRLTLRFTWYPQWRDLSRNKVLTR